MILSLVPLRIPFSSAVIHLQPSCQTGTDLAATTSPTPERGTSTTRTLEIFLHLALDQGAGRHTSNPLTRTRCRLPFWAEGREDRMHHDMTEKRRGRRNKIDMCKMSESEQHVSWQTRMPKGMRETQGLEADLEGSLMQRDMDGSNLEIEIIDLVRDLDRGAGLDREAGLEDQIPHNGLTTTIPREG